MATMRMTRATTPAKGPRLLVLLLLVSFSSFDVFRLPLDGVFFPLPRAMVVDNGDDVAFVRWWYSTSIREGIKEVSIFKRFNDTFGYLLKLLPSRLQRTKDDAHAR